MRIRFVGSSALVLGLTILLGAPQAGGQGVGAVTGVVQDSTGAKIEGAEVRLLGSEVVARTDSAGVFLLAAPAGNAEVHVRRLGYQPISLVAVIVAGQMQTLAIVLAVQPTLVDSVLVSGTPEVSPRMVSFEERRARGVGSFITRKDIEKRRPHVMSEMLRTVPGVRLDRANSGRNSVDMTRNFDRRSKSICPVQLFVDGHPYRAYGFGLDNFIPEEVEAIEVYRSVSELPPEYNFGSASCGVIALWTRDPPPKEK
jgi:carboxypeptidase family protein/TonB-dependent receptor-like protein